jgi:hypothetical protein
LADKRPSFRQATAHARGDPKTKREANRGEGVGETASSPREGGTRCRPAGP